MATSKISESCVIICLLGLTSVTYVTLGNSECISPLGMADGRIKNSHITVTRVHRTAYGEQARLHQNIPEWGAWCVDVSRGLTYFRNYDQHIEIDLVNLTKITGIATQGREYNEGTEKVEDYKLSYRKDGGDYWHFYPGKDQDAKIFSGNTDVSTVVRHDLDPTIMARYIRVHPGYAPSNNACMRLELYGCVPEEDILSYSMPVGHTTKNGKVHYKDTSYDGVITKGFYKDGTGILTDGKFGPGNAKELKGEGWVGWSTDLTQSQYIDITFEFFGVRKFTNVILTVNVEKKHGYAVFYESRIFFASTKDGFSDTSFLQYTYSPGDFPAQHYDRYNANVTLSLCKNAAKFVKMRLYFGGKWLLITEISFNSVPASTDEKMKSLKVCLRNTGFRTTIPSECKTCKTKPETANSIAMFVGIAVTLAIVLLVLFVILIIYKRRHQASKLPISVDRVGIENQTAEAETESLPNHNQGLGHVGPTSGRTAPYEEIQIISPPSVCEVLSRNSPDGRETTNSDRSSGDVIPANGRTSPYSVVQIISPPFVHEMLNQNRPDGMELEMGLERANSDRSSAYVITANGRTAPYEVVQIVSPPSVHDEHNTNQSDGRETRNSDCSSGYEEVQISSLSGYTELNKNRADETNDRTYQKLLKRDSDYVIPAHAGEIKTTPGYTELDNTKRVLDDSASYQKLIKK